MDGGDALCTRRGGALTRSDPRLFIGGGLQVTIDAHGRSTLGALTAIDFDGAQNRLWVADANGHLSTIATAGRSHPSAFRAVLRPTDAS